MRYSTHTVPVAPGITRVVACFGQRQFIYSHNFPLRLQAVAYANELPDLWDLVEGRPSIEHVTRHCDWTELSNPFELDKSTLVVESPGRG